MKNLMIVLLVIIAFGLGGYYAFQKFFTQNVNNMEFQWGVTARPPALGKYSPQVWKKQVELAKDMGVKWIRLGYDYNGGEKALDINEGIIKIVKDSGLDVMLVVEMNPKERTKDNFEIGLRDGKNIAGRYKGKIKYYQIANEGSAEVLKGGTLNGQEAGHYDQEKYQSLVSYMKGLSQGISEADPQAVKVVSMVFTHYIYLDMLEKDKLDYDLLGVNWFDWMGPIDEKKLENGELLVDKLKSYNRPLIITEINHLASPDPKNPRTRTVVNQEKQAKFISDTAKWAWKNRDFMKGFYVLELVDNINTPYPEYFGLVTAQKTPSGTYIPGEVRKAYEAYKQVISESK